MNTFEMDKTYVANTYGRFPVEIVSGKGAVVVDSNGKEYIDLGSGIAVNTFGIADDEWVKAVTDQLNTLQHMSVDDMAVPLSRLVIQDLFVRRKR